MSEKKYQVLDEFGNVIADNMILDTALVVIGALCQKYYMEKAYYTLKECDNKEEKE